MNYGAIVGAQIAAQIAGRNANAIAIAEQGMTESTPQAVNVWTYSDSAFTVRGLIIIAIAAITPFLIWGIVEFVKEHRGNR